ncbi:MAG: hypothetical protein ACKVP7_20815 [Hyphomicrobiaceae bacterium]
MSGQQKDTEIPEDLFRKDFGGGEIRRAMEDKRREKANIMAAGGAIMLLLIPVALAAFAAIIATIMYYGLNFSL